MKVPLKLGDALFTVNLLLLLVFGTDVVLGFTGQHDEGLHCLIIKISGWSLTTTELAYVCITTHVDIVSPTALRSDTLGQTDSQYFHLIVSLTVDIGPQSWSPENIEAFALMVFVDRLHQLLPKLY